MEPLHGTIPGVLSEFDGWRNLVTGECRRSRPSAGELDWVRSLEGDACSEAGWR